jgi:hypothetical protein
LAREDAGVVVSGGFVDDVELVDGVFNRWGLGGAGQAAERAGVEGGEEGDEVAGVGDFLLGPV